MMNIRTKVYGNQKCKNPFMETKKDKRETIEETAKATVHAIKNGNVEFRLWLTEFGVSGACVWRKISRQLLRPQIISRPA